MWLPADGSSGWCRTQGYSFLLVLPVQVSWKHRLGRQVFRGLLSPGGDKST